MTRRLTLALVLGALALPALATLWMLTTHRPERDDERWFEYAVRQRAVDVRERLRETPLRPVIGLFSRPPPRSCVVHVVNGAVVDPP